MMGAFVALLDAVVTGGTFARVGVRSDRLALLDVLGGIDITNHHQREELT